MDGMCSGGNSGVVSCLSPHAAGASCCYREQAGLTLVLLAVRHTVVPLPRERPSQPGRWRLCSCSALALARSLLADTVRQQRADRAGGSMGWHGSTAEQGCVGRTEVPPALLGLIQY